MIVRNSIFAQEVYLEKNAVVMSVASHLLRAIAALIATPCALCAGYFWSNGRSMNTTARATSSEQTSIARGVEAGSGSCTACARFEHRGEAPFTVDMVSPAALQISNRKPGAGNQPRDPNVYGPICACPFHAVNAGSFSRSRKPSTLTFRVWNPDMMT